MPSKILVVDDEPQILKVVSHRLSRDGYLVGTAMDGEEALARFEAFRPDLVILDLMLPKLDGFEVCRRIRSYSSTPIIVLSAKGDEVDKVTGFRMGADDYMTKPFSPSELSLRVNAVLRRTSLKPQLGEMDIDQVIRHGKLYINRRSRVVKVGDRNVALTAKEFDLIWLLASHPDYVFTREQLLYQVWQSSYEGDVNNVTVLVSRLRDKIEDDPSNPQFIKTVWGVGYKFSTESACQSGEEDAGINWPVSS